MKYYLLLVKKIFYKLIKIMVDKEKILYYYINIMEIKGEIDYGKFIKND